MDSNGSQDSGRGAGRRSGKKPMQFMFIDSTSHGVNAKPDKAVRSFVMKSARNKKTWSTRQKSPKADAESNAGSPSEPQPSPVSARIKTELDFPKDAEVTPSPDAWFPQSHGSEVSSRSASFRSSGSSRQPYITPPSSSGSVCDNPDCTGESCGQPHGWQMALANRHGFAVNFVADFDCLSVTLQERERGLLNNFVNVYSKHFVPLDHHQSSKPSTTKWVSNGILNNTTSKPFIYALLTSSALYPQAAGSMKPSDALHYKTETIGAVNELLDDSLNRVDDNNIAAVFILLCIEESQLAFRQNHDGSEEHRKFHLNGLQTMIKQRGGLAALGSNQCLQTFIWMHAIAHVVTTFERPYTTLVDPMGQTQPYDIPSFRDQPSLPSTLRLFRPLGLDTTLFQIISDSAVFVGDFTAWIEDHTAPVSPLELQKHACLLLYRLFDWYKEGEENLRSTRHPVDQSVCLALLIFLVMTYEQNYQLMVPTAASKLTIALNQCLSQWHKAPDVLMWILSLGALATQGTAEFSFFKQNCIRMLAAQGFNGMTDPEEILDRLRKCLWVPRLDREVKRMWPQMGFCNGEEAIESIEAGLKSPDRIKKEDVVGGLTVDRFFGKRSESR